MKNNTTPAPAETKPERLPPSDHVPENLRLLYTNVETIKLLIAEGIADGLLQHMQHMNSGINAWDYANARSEVSSWLRNTEAVGHAVFAKAILEHVTGTDLYKEAAALIEPRLAQEAQDRADHDAKLRAAMSEASALQAKIREAKEKADAEVERLKSTLAPDLEAAQRKLAETEAARPDAAAPRLA